MPAIRVYMCTEWTQRAVFEHVFICIWVYAYIYIYGSMLRILSQHVKETLKILFITALIHNIQEMEQAYVYQQMNE